MTWDEIQSLKPGDMIYTGQPFGMCAFVKHGKNHSAFLLVGGFLHGMQCKKRRARTMRKAVFLGSSKALAEKIAFYVDYLKPKEGG